MADEIFDERIGGVGEDVLRLVVLSYARLVSKDRNAVAHLYCLVDVVRNEDDRLLDLLLETQELVL
jgi:hypothetical protein